ncbi:MAG: hypothetical protein SFZ02_00660 [bacterium]|nr:hypothetical protein [bacterium]
MANKQFFMMPDESISFLGSIMSQFQLNAVLRVITRIEIGFGKQARQVTFQQSQELSHYLTDVDSIYLTPKRLNDEEAYEALNNPIRYGCVIFTLPTIEGNDLEMSYFGAKSAWLDDVNLDIPILYKAIAKPLKKLLHYPMWVDVGNPNGLRLDKSVGYTQGAKLWSEQGGNLLQLKTRFFTQEKIER